MHHLEIQGETFYQLPLTPWLSAVVLETLTDVRWDTSHLKLVAQILRRVHVLASLLLIPDGMSPEEFYQKLEQPGWQDARQEFFKLNLGVLNAGRLVRDFLSVNDLASVVTMVTEIAEQFSQMIQLDGEWTTLSPSPVGATPANGTRSEV